VAVAMTNAAAAVQRIKTYVLTFNKTRRSNRRRLVCNAYVSGYLGFHKYYFLDLCSSSKTRKKFTICRKNVVLRV